jgi:hypothetical protein
MINFYKKQSSGAFVLGTEEFNFIYVGQLYYLDNNPNLVIFRSSTNEKLYDSPYSEYNKENGVPYASFAELETVIEDFFFNVGGIKKFQNTNDNGVAILSATSTLQQLQASAEKQDDALGVRGFIVTGSTKTSIPTGYYAYRCIS